LLFAITAAVAVIALGVTFSVLVQTTESRANNFSVGNVSIRLDEPGWDPPPSGWVLRPGVTMPKDPTITNTGHNNAYVYIEVQIPRAVVRTYGSASNILPPGVQDLFTYTVNPGWTEITGERSVITSGAGAEISSVYLYAYTANNGILPPGGSTPPLFSSVTFANVLEGEIPKGETFEIPVTAYAIQCEHLGETGLTTIARMTDAFSIYKQAAR